MDIGEFDSAVAIVAAGIIEELSLLRMPLAAILNRTKEAWDVLLGCTYAQYD